MVINADTFAAIIVTTDIGIIGFLGARELSKIDKNIESLWGRYEKLAERIANLEKRNHH